MTKQELNWITKMQKLLDQCPERFGFYTVGDPELGIFDLGKEPLFDENVDMVYEISEHGALLGSLRFPSNVHGVCG